MTQLDFNTDIAATPLQVWFALWNDYSYRQWTSAFSPGSHAVSLWEKGSRIHFLGPEGMGAYADIADKIENEVMVFEHLGEVKNFEEQPSTGPQGTEAYFLKATAKGTHLQVKLSIDENYCNMMNEMFPKALTLLKTLAEDFKITITADIASPLAQCWQHYTLPQHIVEWNFASPEWCCPKADIDLREGGSFSQRMEACDGSMGFDFSGTYTLVQPLDQIDFTMEDGRKASVKFVAKGDEVTCVTVAFEPENENSYELQYAGWNAILENFKTYSEKQAAA